MELEVWLGACYSILETLDLVFSSTCIQVHMCDTYGYSKHCYHGPHISEVKMNQEEMKILIFKRLKFRFTKNEETIENPA